MSAFQNNQPVSRALSFQGARLENLTLDQSELPSSPKGSSRIADKMVSPGRTMKEYEEQMAELKKENFNLKLRIYFIEERQEQMKGLKDVDDLFKKNVELSCELETLKKDLSDKEELLLQSAKAVEILQKQHKKQIEELKTTSIRDRTYLEEHIANLQKMLREKELTINQFDDSSAMYAMAFGYDKGQEQAKKMDDLKLELNNVTLKVVHLEEELHDERKKYGELQRELEQGQEECARLKNQVLTLETDVEKRDARLQQAYVDLDRKTEQLNTLTARLVKKEKAKTENESSQKAVELEAKIATVEKKLHAAGPAGGHRKNSHDSSSSSKDVSVKQRLRRDDRCLSRQLQDAQSRLVQLEEESQAMQTKLHETQVTCNNKDSDIDRLREEYRKACVTIQALIKKNKIRDKEMSLLQADVEKKEKLLQEISNSDKNNEDIKKQLEIANQRNCELVEEHKSVTSELETQMQTLKSLLKGKEIRLKELEEKYNSPPTSDCNDNRIIELESKLEEMKIKLQNIQLENKFDMAGCEKPSVTKDKEELVIKNNEIEFLKTELKKRTFNLQELVNKELWDKNREIEKLNKLCERRQVEIIQLKQQISLTEADVPFSPEKLKDSGNFNSLMMRDVQLMRFDEIKDSCSQTLFANDDKKVLRDQLLRCWEENKFLTKKIEELEERLQNMPERDSDSRLIQTLKSDLSRAKQDVEAAQKSREEVIAASSLLTNRLQELANFLESLLPSLGAKKRRVVRQAVERSRELSRSFSATADDPNSWESLQPSLYIPLLPDFSAVDFWSGDEITDLTLEEEVNDEVDTISQLRSEVELLREQLKQKDNEIAKINSSMWSLDFESLNTENNSLAKIVSMFDNLETNENIVNKNQCTDNNGNFDSFVSGKNVLSKSEIKSSNIGEIVITSRKVSSKEEKGSQNIGSESEAWSEPDRNVSLARIGLTDDASIPWAHDDSSDTTDGGQKTSTGSRKMKYDANELRRLQCRVNSLEEANQALRGELNILHQLAPPALSSREDKSTSIEGISLAASVPSSLLDEIRNQREKLESSLFYNDNIRRQLEGIFNFLKVKDDEISQIQQLKELKDDSSKIRTEYYELEAQCKALEAQCSDLEVALHSERSTCNKKEEKCLEMEKDVSALKEEQKIWKENAEQLKNKIDELQSELKMKCDELSEKDKIFIDYKNGVEKETSIFKMKLEEAAEKVKDEREKWLQMEDELQTKLKSLQCECNDLKLKLNKFSEEKQEIIIQLHSYKLEDENNKKDLDNLKMKLGEMKSKEEQASSAAEEWKFKCVIYQKDSDEAKMFLKDAEQKILDLERINSELQTGLRNQVEAASKQCSQAEFLVKDLEIKHKHRESVWRDRVSEVEREQSEREAEWRRQLDAATLTTSEVVLERTRLANDKLRLQQEIRRRDTSVLERLKCELEKRVAELEAANSELEARLSVQVTKLPSDSENDEHENVVHFTSTKHIKWPSTSTSPPMSPSSKSASPHLPLSPRFAPHRSNDISSDYMSDQDNGQICSVFYPQRSNVSASPDLGIESDQGRLSSLENPHPHTVSVRLEEGVNELAKLEEENLYLKQHLMRTRQALENTLSQLTAANQKKRQVERAICRQLGKTHLILQKARVNLETDVDGS